MGSEELLLRDIDNHSNSMCSSPTVYGAEYHDRFFPIGLDRKAYE